LYFLFIYFYGLHQLWIHWKKKSAKLYFQAITPIVFSLDLCAQKLHFQIHYPQSYFAPICVRKNFISRYINPEIMCAETSFLDPWSWWEIFGSFKCLSWVELRLFWWDIAFALWYFYVLQFDCQCYKLWNYVFNMVICTGFISQSEF